MERTILHCDCNAFYASVECLMEPSLKDVPMAVGGSVSERHGIILAKNELAKKQGVVTAETIWQARRKCPELLIVPPHHREYAFYSRRVNAVYEQYTDLCEPFGIDETFLDVTHSMHLFKKDGRGVAEEIRERVKQEIGLTISVGVSFNKVFAKLGSDYKKPDAVTLISKENYKTIVFPLPPLSMIFVGPAVNQKLADCGITTIGALAGCKKEFLTQLFGKQGESMWRAANGLDDSPVRPADFHEAPKSVGQGRTFRRDLTEEEDVKAGIWELSEQVAKRLRSYGLKCAGVQLSVKDSEMKNRSRQTRLFNPTHLAGEIGEAALELAKDFALSGKPVRALTITAIGILPAEEAGEQMNFFYPSKKREKREKLESALYAIRRKYGDRSVESATVAASDLFKRQREEEEETEE